MRTIFFFGGSPSERAARGPARLSPVAGVGEGLSEAMSSSVVAVRAQPRRSRDDHVNGIITRLRGGLSADVGFGDWWVVGGGWSKPEAPARASTTHHPPPTSHLQGPTPDDLPRLQI